MKRLIYLFIVIIIIIFTSSALNNPSRTLSKQEVASLLYPDKHIEVDTLGKNQYIVRFMNGENEVSRMELRPEVLEVKKDTSEGGIDYDSLGLRLKWHVWYIDTIKTTYDLKLSPQRTKIALTKRYNNKQMKHHMYYMRDEDIDRAFYEHSRTYTHAESLTVYNEEGKRMYGLDADSVGWDENPGPNIPGPVVREPPYSYIKALCDNGELILSAYSGETVFNVQHRIISRNGNVISEGFYEGGVSPNSVLGINNRSYLLMKYNKIYYLYPVTDNGKADSIKLGEPEEYLWGQLMKVNEDVVILLGHYNSQTIKKIKNNKITETNIIPKEEYKYYKFYNTKNKIFFTTEDSILFEIKGTQIERIKKLNIQPKDIYMDNSEIFIIKNNLELMRLN